MRCLPALAASLLVFSATAFATVRPHHRSSSHAMVRHTADTRKTHTEHAAYPGMSSERATEIQSALIRQGYLSGDPSGSWDSSSIAAMQKLQSDNGWQTKLVPDSRALIKLGLGPNSTPPQTATASAVTPPAPAN